jgi:hypothetical protein
VLFIGTTRHHIEPQDQDSRRQAPREDSRQEVIPSSPNESRAVVTWLSQVQVLFSTSTPVRMWVATRRPRTCKTSTGVDPRQTAERGLLAGSSAPGARYRLAPVRRKVVPVITQDR